MTEKVEFTNEQIFNIVHVNLVHYELFKKYGSTKVLHDELTPELEVEFKEISSNINKYYASQKDENNI